MRIGIAGTGSMGAAIAQRLLGLGRRVTVWNRTRAKLKTRGNAIAADQPVRWARKARRSPPSNA